MKIFLIILLFIGGMTIKAEIKKQSSNNDENRLTNFKKFVNFKTIAPDFGMIPSEKTEVEISNDNNNIYINFYCYDSDKNKIKANLTSRDNIDSDDWVSVELDMFNNAQTNLLLQVNPYGIQQDGIINQYGTEDLSYDLVWESFGEITEEGYKVKIILPFKNLKFPNEENFEIGVSFRRSIKRKSEILSFPEYNPSMGSRFTQKHKISLNNVDYSLPINIIPSYVATANKVEKNGKWNENNKFNDLGFNVRFGLSSQLALEATYNPDFSQIESDAGSIDVNLRSGLYYGEKRPFFLEGKQNYYFAGNTAGYKLPVPRIVNTRNIVDPLAGLKLTGKIGSNNSISVITAIDEYRDEINSVTDKNSFYSIVRFRHNYRPNNYVGGYYTSRETEGYFNRVTGVDFNYNISPKSKIGFNSYFSFTKNNDQVKSGNVIGLEYLYDSRTLDFEVALRNVSTNFHTELGYVRRTGISTVPAMLMYTLYPESNFFQNVVLLFNSKFSIDHSTNRYEYWHWFGLEFHLPNKSWIWFGYNLETENYNKKLYENNAVLAGFFLNLSSFLDAEIVIDYGKRIRYKSENSYGGYGLDADVSLTFKPTNSINSAWSISYSDFYNFNHVRDFDYVIIRTRNTYQVNKYLFVRGILEYNSFHKRLNTDILLSYTYIPGTVLQLGYGSTHLKEKWENDRYIPLNSFNQKSTAFFFKVSYNYAM